MGASINTSDSMIPLPLDLRDNLKLDYDHPMSIRHRVEMAVPAVGGWWRRGGTINSIIPEIWVEFCMTVAAVDCVQCVGPVEPELFLYTGT